MQSEVKVQQLSGASGASRGDAILLFVFLNKGFLATGEKGGLRVNGPEAEGQMDKHLRCEQRSQSSHCSDSGARGFYEVEVSWECLVSEQ